MKRLKINHAAVVVLTIIHQIVPMLWFSSSLFGTQWMDLLGLKMEEILENQSPVPYVVALIAALILNYTMAWLFKQLRIEKASDGLKYAVIFWVGLYFAEMLVQDTFSFRPLALTFINTGMYLVNFCISGLVLGAWRKHDAY
jgi:hypothetical protein